MLIPMLCVLIHLSTSIKRAETALSFEAYLKSACGRPAVDFYLSGKIEFDCMTVLSGHENEVKHVTQPALGFG